MNRGGIAQILLWVVFAIHNAVPWNVYGGLTVATVSLLSVAVATTPPQGIVLLKIQPIGLRNTHVNGKDVKLNILRAVRRRRASEHVQIATPSRTPTAFLGSAPTYFIKTSAIRNANSQSEGSSSSSSTTFLPGTFHESTGRRDARVEPIFAYKLALLDNIATAGRNFRRLIKHAVHPQIVSDEYYSYAHWRMLERFAISTALALASQTQSLVKGGDFFGDSKDAKMKDESGVDTSQNSWINRITKGKVSSTLATIVLKDIVSRAFNFIWFGKIGAGFDDNPKAFRLLGGFLCSVAGITNFVGNALNFEPKMLLSVCVNVLKHIGMLTMLASQAAFHTTFCVKNAATNVGEITAKLEAQSPICDFIGMATGMQLATMLSTQPCSIQAGIFTGVSVISNISTYMCAKSVCFRNLNPQRCFVLLEDFASVLLRRLDRYLRYHKLRLEALRHRMEEEQDLEDGDDIDSSSSSSSSSNSCFEDDECGAITEMIYNYEFDTATRLLHRFTSKHLCNKLKKARETIDTTDDSNVRYPDEPLNLLQKRIRMKFLTPEQVAEREPLMFPWREGALKHGAVKYSLADMSVCPETLAEYLKIFKGQRFVVVLGSDGIVECAIHRSAKPRDAILAILTYNIAEKLWTLLDESTEPDFIDHQLEQIWDMCKRSAVSLKDVLVRLNSRVNLRPVVRKRTHDGDQLREEKELWRWGLQTVRYAYTMAQSCIDEVMLSIEAAHWDIEHFELNSPFKN